MATKLEVRNLTISFRTNNGAVRAVRDVSFNLDEGETLAIVGESGSGKSVTTRAIMGILAGNAIIEDGEIIYDGRDLLKIPEEDFHTLRGHRLSMVFQDPLSALNPIMRIGKQLTEAMLLNDKERRADGRKRFNAMLAHLEKHMQAAGVADAKVCCDTFRKALLPKFVPETLDEGFMSRFRENVKKALAHAAQQSDAARARAVQVLGREMPAFTGKTLDAGAARAAASRCADAVESAIDPLALDKDNRAYVFRSSMNAYIDRYVLGEKRNPRELKRYEKDRKQYEELTRKGKFAPSVVPLNLVDTDKALNNISGTVSALKAHFEAPRPAEDMDARAEALITYLRDRAADHVHRLTREQARQRAIELMKEVGIPEPERRYHQYPFEFSGGMRQRIVIAIALSANPDILICDEPTTALDVTIQAQILELINRLKRERRLSIIFITHDLGVVANMADRIAVMYAGKIVESGTSEDVFYDPRHPYTWALLASMPDLETREKLSAIPGTPPNMILPPKGDAFAARNRYAMQIDLEEQPPMFRVSDTHQAATWLLHPDAPKVEPPAIVTERIARMKKRAQQSAGGEKA